MTSIKPLNSNNAPNDFERSALLDFDKGKKSVYRIENINGGGIFQYMMPLFMEKSCMECHGHQGYKVGDVRGGISVSIPMEETLAAMRKGKISMFLYTVFFILIVISVLYFWSRRLMYKYIELRRDQVETGKTEAATATVVTLSHEINNALTVIMGHAYILVDTTDESDPQYTQFSDIQKHARHICNLVKKLRALKTVNIKTYINDTRMLDIDQEKGS